MPSGDPDRVAWLLVSVSAGADASLRVAIWRQLHKLGAVYLQNSVCLLPDVPLVAETIDLLVTRVRAGSGQAKVLHIQLEAADAAGNVAEQPGERAGEQGAVVGTPRPARAEERPQHTAARRRRPLQGGTGYTQ